jgi:hypothetical protein
MMTMGSAMALGADCIEDCDVLRAGRTAAVIGRRVTAPSTLTLPGRLVRSARRTTLRMPTRWPRANDFLTALARLRALPPPT